MSTQLQRALSAIPAQHERENLRSRHTSLRDVLDESQNPAPHGKRDGTIRSWEWTQLRSVELRLSALLEAVDAYVEDGGSLVVVPPETTAEFYARLEERTKIDAAVGQALALVGSSFDAPSAERAVAQLAADLVKALRRIEDRPARSRALVGILAESLQREVLR